ncbi:hypothetical protein DPSP01_014482 [Paraphaeosphaeria sporulosa]
MILDPHEPQWKNCTEDQDEFTPLTLLVREASQMQSSIDPAILTYSFTDLQPMASQGLPVDGSTTPASDLPWADLERPARPQPQAEFVAYGVPGMTEFQIPSDEMDLPNSWPNILRHYQEMDPVEDPNYDLAQLGAGPSEGLNATPERRATQNAQEISDVSRGTTTNSKGPRSPNHRSGGSGKCPTYSELIFEALQEADDNTMTLEDIYKCIKDTEKVIHKKAKSWHGSIRYDLSVNRAFEKVTRKGEEGRKVSRKVSQWRLTPNALQRGIKPTTQYRKNRFRNRPSPPECEE